MALLVACGPTQAKPTRATEPFRCPPCAAEGLTSVNLWDKPGSLVDGARAIGSVRVGQAVSYQETRFVGGRTWVHVVTASGPDGWMLEDFIK